MRFVSPSTTASSAKTRHATGIENRFWMAICALWTDTWRFFESSMSARNSAMVFSLSPFSGATRGKTRSGSSVRTSSFGNRLTV